MKQPNSTIKKIGKFLSALVLLTAIGAVSAEASTVTRSFSTLTPQAGSPLTVSLTVDVLPPDNAAPNDFYIIDEIFPAGWTISDPGTGDTTQAGHIKWAVLNGAASIINQYTITVPAGTSGPNAFSGEFAFGSNPAPLSILGDTTVTVQANQEAPPPPPPPQPNTVSLNLTVPNEWAIFSAPSKLSAINIIPADVDAILSFNSATQQFVQMTDSADPAFLNPLNAFFIKPNKATTITFTLTPVLDPELVSKVLNTGWNLISTNNLGLAKNELSSIQVANGTNGMVTLNVPQTHNSRKSVFADWGQNTNIDINANPITDLPLSNVSPFDGYWANMNGGINFSKIIQ